MEVAMCATYVLFKMMPVHFWIAAWYSLSYAKTACRADDDAWMTNQDYTSRVEVETVKYKIRLLREAAGAELCSVDYVRPSFLFPNLLL